MRTFTVSMLTTGSLLVPAIAAVDFNRDMRPILYDKCFACHGPDTKKKDLVRLDLEELAKKDLGDYLSLIHI